MMCHGAISRREMLGLSLTAAAGLVAVPKALSALGAEPGAATLALARQCQARP